MPVYNFSNMASDVLRVYVKFLAVSLKLELDHKHIFQQKHDLNLKDQDKKRLKEPCRVCT